ncbi:hypothetical protein K7I13_12910 [Brucepastera parasyntrophica]|uniref:hypothetical protein n=1 Tax=Brucepastera parasyntrophica TaxID=2880008 RepID=UPI002109F403|nr:hypothetical protein [Brucepastera parasyntrophica]ULQ59365.1 hypothetical protein K7I13_12910 [Brucepastera parasyntrophica]
MCFLKPFQPGILFFLVFLAGFNLQNNPVSGVYALSFSAAFSHAGDAIQEGKSDIKFSAKITPFSGFLLLKSDNPADITDVSVYSFGIRFTPKVFLDMKWSITAGSVGVSGLPARAKNPVSHTYSPEYKFLRTHSYPVFSSGNTKTPSITDSEIGIELFIKNWNFAAYLNPFQPQEEPAWLFVNKEFSGLPLNSSLLVSLFAGTRKTIPSSNSSWLLPQIQVPESRLFIPAGEIVFHSKLLTWSASFFANAGPLQHIKGALNSAVTLHFKYADISAGLFRADREYITLKGSIETIPERYFVSSAFTIPVNRKLVKKIDFSLLASYNRYCADKFASQDTICFYAGGVIKISSKYVNGKFSLEKKIISSIRKAERPLLF